MKAIKRLHKPREKVMRKLWLVVLALLFMSGPTNELDVQPGVESDKGRIIITVFGKIRHTIFKFFTRKFYSSVSWLIVIITYPEKYLHSTLKPKFGQRIMEARRKVSTNKRLRMFDREMYALDHKPFTSWLSFWGMEIWSLWILGGINPLYKPDRIHMKNQILKERASVMRKMQSYFVVHLGVERGIAIMKKLHCTSYYFSTSGDNNNDGLTELTPKSGNFVQSYPAGHNAMSFSAGDNVLFKCGDDFNPEDGTQILYYQGHGTALNPITYTTYGTGAKPILPTFNAEGHVGSQDLFHHFIGLKITAYNQLGNGDGIQVGSFSYSIANGIYIEDCEIVKNDAGYMDVCIILYDPEGCEVYNCTLNTANCGLVTEAITGGTRGNNYFHELVITGVMAEGANDGLAVHDNGGTHSAGANWWICDCEIHGFEENCLDLIVGSYVYAFNNVLYDADTIITMGYSINHVYVFQNFVQVGLNGRGGINSTNPYVWEFNNIVELTYSTTNRYCVSITCVSVSFPAVEHVYVYYNTLVSVAGNQRGIIYFAGDANNWGTTADSIAIKNNIMVTKNATGSTCIYSTGTYAMTIDNVLLDIDYNCWYQGSTAFLAFAPVGSHNWTDYQGHGHDAHGMNVDPLLTDVTQTDRDYTDYIPTPSSPVLDAGVAISSGTYYYYDGLSEHCLHSMTGISVDYIGDTRVNSDMGALSYDAGEEDDYLFTSSDSGVTTGSEQVTIRVFEAGDVTASAVIEWSESNGAGPTVTDGIEDNLNFGSVDETGIDASEHPIVAGENSFEKWIRLHIDSNPDSHDISDIKVWMSRGLNPFYGTYLKTNAKEDPNYGGAQTYASPSATDRSSTYDYDENMPTTKPTGANLGIGGSLTGFMSAGYSDYLILQLQVDADDVSWQEMEFDYEYVET